MHGGRGWVGSWAGSRRTSLHMDGHMNVPRRSRVTHMRSRMTQMVDCEAGHAKRALTMTAAALLATAAMALAQEPVRLTLEEAIDLARENNPTFLKTQNNEAAADWSGRISPSRRTRTRQSTACGGRGRGSGPAGRHWESVRTVLHNQTRWERDRPGPLPADRRRPRGYADARKLSRREGCQGPAHDPSGPYSRRARGIAGPAAEFLGVRWSGPSGLLQ